MESPDQAGILIVDDEPRNRLAFAEILESLHQDVVTVSSGEEALRLLLGREFAVILLDVHMPGMDGFETADLIRKRIKSRHTPIIFVSAVQTATGHVYRGYSVGAVDYIFKPVEPAILRSKVSVFVDLFRQGQEMRRQADALREHEARMHALELAEQRARLESETYRVREELLHREIDAAGARAAEELAQTRALLLADLEAKNTELRAKNAELEAFTYTVSHDLRAPLRAMQGFSQVLMQEYAAGIGTEGREYLERIAAAAERMDALIRDLLSYSRLGRGERVLEPLAAADLVHDALERVAADRDAREAQVVVAIDPRTPRLVCHAETTLMVLSNLLTNAMKFVAPTVRPDVRVEAQVRGTAVRITVSDNGIGIAAEHHDRIFRVFERLHGERAYPGTGIGLAIVRRGVESMGGLAGVESIEGGGSRFWVELPAAREDLALTETGHTAAAALPEGTEVEGESHV